MLIDTNDPLLCFVLEGILQPFWLVFQQTPVILKWKRDFLEFLIHNLRLISLKN